MQLKLADYLASAGLIFLFGDSAGIVERFQRGEGLCGGRENGRSRRNRFCYKFVDGAIIGFRGDGVGESEKCNRGIEEKITDIIGKYAEVTAVIKHIDYRRNSHYGNDRRGSTENFHGSAGRLCGAEYRNGK